MAKKRKTGITSIGTKIGELLETPDGHELRPFVHQEQPGRILTIDTAVWTTIAQKAAMEGVKLNTLCHRITRFVEGRRTFMFELWYIPELDITLVKK